MEVFLQHDLNFFVALEQQVWEALKNGDINADAELLSDDFLGVYESGLSTKEDHLAQLREGPVVSDYKIGRARLLRLGPKMVSLTYSVTVVSVGNEAQNTQHLYYITSIWAHRYNKWINIFSQDTRGNVHE